MILVSLRDLQFRRRRFAVAIVGTALVLGITLVLSGMTSSFDNEARRSVESFSGDAWVVPAGATGAFLSSGTLSARVADEISAATGLPATPVALLFGKLQGDGSPKQVNVQGVPPGSFAVPRIRDGRALERDGEVVVDRLLGVGVGETVVLDDRPLLVVGRTKGLSYRAGIPSVHITLAEAQGLGFGGADLASAIVSAGPVTSAPAGTTVLSPDQVRSDLLEPMKEPKQTIGTMQWLLWAVATMIVGSVVYLSALDRVRDFAVFKAMGAADRSVLIGLLAQSLLLCAIAYAIGIAISVVIAPMMPMQSEVPVYAYYGLAAVAAAAAIVSSVAGARRALSVDPAIAFGGA